MRYITLDGFVYGTGVRDIYTNEYLNVDDLDITSSLKEEIKSWAAKYKGNQLKVYSEADNIFF